MLLKDERQAALSWARDQGAARPSIRAAKMMTTSTAYLMEDGGRVVGLVACAGREIWGYVDDGTEALRRFRQLPGREVGRAACRGWADG